MLSGTNFNITAATALVVVPTSACSPLKRGLFVQVLTEYELDFFGEKFS